MSKAKENNKDIEDTSSALYCLESFYNTSKRKLNLYPTFFFTLRDFVLSNYKIIVGVQYIQHR